MFAPRIDCEFGNVAFVGQKIHWGDQEANYVCSQFPMFHPSEMEVWTCTWWYEDGLVRKIYGPVEFHPTILRVFKLNLYFAEICYPLLTFSKQTFLTSAKNWPLILSLCHTIHRSYSEGAVAISCTKIRQIPNMRQKEDAKMGEIS